MCSLLLFTIGAFGCSKEELGIEMTNLSYTSEYENKALENYMKLKRNIEYEVGIGIYICICDAMHIYSFYRGFS
jgi:hypothetical protein